MFDLNQYIAFELQQTLSHALQLLPPLKNSPMQQIAEHISNVIYRIDWLIRTAEMWPCVLKSTKLSTRCWIAPNLKIHKVSRSFYMHVMTFLSALSSANLSFQRVDHKVKCYLSSAIWGASKSFYIPLPIWLVLILLLLCFHDFGENLNFTPPGQIAITSAAVIVT